MADATNTGTLPSDAEIEKQRKADQARAALEKGRKIRSEKAAKRRAEKLAKGEDSSDDDTSDSSDLNPETLHAGCRALVRFTFAIAALGAWLAGGTLAPLEDAEIDAGADEAETLVRRFTWLAKLLAFVGFPLWLARTTAAKFTKKPEPAKPAPLTLAHPPKPAQGAP